tara:strand:+ start:333 stop:458 length:126 start_codon:yes stop_codon:yes gene_type:complete
VASLVPLVVLEEHQVVDLWVRVVKVGMALFLYAILLVARFL